ncbi:putative integral membrane protein [Streptomyces avermitilis MA-4680 = NBRC 14893]|uniref:Integral membrane protein n=3 Tax=Streptomyces TaxID=1883 RepID=Q825W0_STRAW|nr:putative integral membrane protein [Streptomyces avermitilis MA-4680 = NBRC 14893]
MLAASVVVGAGTLGSFPYVELVLLLLLTGVAFWIAHVHAQLFGARMAQQGLDRRIVLHVCRDEWPIVKAAVPPAAAVAVSPLLGLGVQGALWLALSVAVAGQVGWSAAAARRAGASWGLVAVSASVNLVLGLLIIALKISLTH